MTQKLHNCTFDMAFVINVLERIGCVCSLFNCVLNCFYF